MAPPSGKPAKSVDKSRSSGSKSFKPNEREKSGMNTGANDRGKADRSEDEPRRSNPSKNEFHDRDQRSEENRKSNSALRQRDEISRKEGKYSRNIERIDEKPRREKSEKHEFGEGDIHVRDKESNNGDIDKKRKRDETAEERAERKAREREKSRAAEIDNEKNRHDRKQRETSEERRLRKKRERDETGAGHRETSDERRQRKLREKTEIGGQRETSEERRKRKRREKAESAGHRETSEERKERKRREKAETGGHRETSEERRERKRRDKDQRETSAERKERKNRERGVDETKRDRGVDEARKSKQAEETPEERHERKKMERSERKAREEENEIKRQSILETAQRKDHDNEKLRKRDETVEERAERKKREKAQREEERREEEEKTRKAMEIDAGDDYNGYDDDFEEYNYDEDFEDDGSNDVIDDKDDVVANGEMTHSPRNVHPADRETLGPEEKPVKDFYSKLEVISYTFDTSKSKKLWLLEKMKKRSLALLNRIELDHFSTDLFILNPLSEYDMFMRKFGYSDTAQAVTQTREDDCEVGIQTEPPDLKESWSQHPPANILKVSETVSLGEESDEMLAVNISQAESFYSSDIARVEDTRKLNRFLMKSGGVMSSLLGSRETIGQSGKAKSYFEIADTFSNLIISQNPLFVNSQVVNMSCNDFKVIVCLKFTKDEGNEKGLICVYSNVSFKEPSNYLVCSSELSSCALTTNPNNPVVFGGALDGTLYMWDLDISAEHVTKTVERGGKEFTLIFETFSTALSLRLPSVENTHKSPVVQLVCLENEPTSSGAMSKFQIASLDDTGSLLFWSYHSSDNENELTLLPGGMTKFSFSHSYNFIRCLSQNRTYKSSKLEFQNVNAIEFLLNKPSNAFFATSNGAIVLCDCFNNESSIKLFKSNTNCEIVCLQICPVETIDVFVTCSQDGVVSLFNFSDPKPLLSLTSTAVHSSFIQCLWHPSFPLLVFLLTEDAILVLDVTKFTNGSMFQCKLRDYASKPVAIRLWNDVVTKRFVLAVAYESGDFEFHDILPDFMKNQSPQYQSKKLRKFISNQLILPPQKV